MHRPGNIFLNIFAHFWLALALDQLLVNAAIANLIFNALDVEYLGPDAASESIRHTLIRDRVTQSIHLLIRKRLHLHYISLELLQPQQVTRIGLLWPGFSREPGVKLSQLVRVLEDLFDFVFNLVYLRQLADETPVLLHAHLPHIIDGFLG